MTSNAREQIAKAIWDGALAESEDRCDQEFDEMGKDYTHFKAADAILADLNSILGKMIKPLEWRYSKEYLVTTEYSDSILGTYEVWTAKGDAYFRPPDRSSGVRVKGGKPEAKVAANAHHRATILSAIGVET